MPSPALGLKKYFRPPWEEMFNWVMSPDLLLLNDTDTPILLHRLSGSRSSPDISFAPPSLALSCSWEVLQDLGSDHLPILLSVSLSLSPVYRPNERPPSLNFQKACWDDFVFYFNSHCPSAEEYSSLSLSSAAVLFASLALNATKFSIPFGRIKRLPKAWWSAEVEVAVSERCKAFAAAHKSDENRQTYISTSRRASSVIDKAKAEAWQTTCSFLSPKSNPKSYATLCSVAGSPSSSSSSPNFPNCSSPRESASVYAAYLRSHFSVSLPKALPSGARGYLTELRRAMCSEEFYSSFCSPFSPGKFLAAVESTLSSPCSRFDFLHSRQGAALAHLDSLPPYDLVLWTDGFVHFVFDKGGSGVLANCSLYGTEATLSFSAGPVCSSFSAEACAILHALCWSRQHHKVCHFSSPTI